MQIKHLIQALQSLMAEHGNLDVLVAHPNADQTHSMGTPLFHLDVISPPGLDHMVMAGIGSANGLRPWITEAPVRTFVRLNPYSMQRVQGLHDMRNGLPVTPIDDTTAPQEEVVAAIKDNPPQTHHESPSPESRGKAKIKKKSKKHKR
jgi:hypothetical protein